MGVQYLFVDSTVTSGIPNDTFLDAVWPLVLRALLPWHNVTTLLLSVFSLYPLPISFHKILYIISFIAMMITVFSILQKQTLGTSCLNDWLSIIDYQRKYWLQSICKKFHIDMHNHVLWKFFCIIRYCFSPTYDTLFSYVNQINATVGKLCMLRPSIWKLKILDLHFFYSSKNAMHFIEIISIKIVQILAYNKNVIIFEITMNANSIILQ